jgi:hypothetical protein
MDGLRQMIEDDRDYYMHQCEQLKEQIKLLQQDGIVSIFEPTIGRAQYPLYL